MPYKYNPLSRKFDYYEVSSGGSGAGTGTGWAGEAANYAALPDASLHSGEVYLVQAASGIWPLRKKAGLWRAAGGSWTYLGAATLTALADVPTIPDIINNYALVSQEGSLSWVDMTTIAGNMTAAQIVQALQTAYPRLTWLHSGNSVDGAPDSATAAAISAFLTATGVNSDYVDFLDLGEVVAGSTFVVADAASASTADNVVLTLGGGTFTIQDATSASTADNVTITDASILAFVIQDATSASTADNVVLVLGGGTFAIADAASASTADNVTITLGESLPTAPTLSLAAGDGQITASLASGGVGATSYEIHWGTSAGSRPNVIDWAAIQAATAPDFPASPYTHTGRSNGTTYYYSLLAINASGSVESAEVSGAPVATVTMSSGNTYGPLLFTGGGNRPAATYSDGQFFIQSFNPALALADQTGYAALTKDGISDYTVSLDVTGTTDMLPPEQENGVISALRVLTAGGSLPFTDPTDIDSRQKYVIYFGYSGGYFVRVIRFNDGPNVAWLTSGGVWQTGVSSDINLTENGLRIVLQRSGAAHTLTLRKLDNTLIRSVTVNSTDSQFLHESATDMLVLGDTLNAAEKSDYYFTKITVKNVSGL